ncbi:MAG: glycosyltransferase [Chloroflexaceae bacterium]|nr:glycosyltransferase [Chloroflexaceae bacterium]
MQIVLVNTHDRAGGAARAAYRLYRGLKHIGCDTTFYVARQSSNDPDIASFKPTRRTPITRLSRIIQLVVTNLWHYRDPNPSKRTAQAGAFEIVTLDRSGYGTAPLDQFPPGDVINLHWVARFIDGPAFFRALPPQRSVVWTLHDMAPFTGGCHYDNGCGRYRQSCGACPQLGSQREHDLSRRIWLSRQASYRHLLPGQLHLVTPSRWMAQEAERSSLFANIPVVAIPNSLDTETFAPRDQHAARDMLGIAQDDRVILFSADSVSNRRKGFSLLIEAFAGLNPDPRLLLLSVGSAPPPLDSPIRQLHLGSIDQERIQSMVYSAADLLVIASLQDNLPNTVMESLACGTPVVGFHVGGIAEMVRPGQTGLLVPAGDSAGLRAAIMTLLDHPEARASMSQQCRQIALHEYTLEVQARRYYALYQQLYEQALTRR